MDDIANIETPNDTSPDIVTSSFWRVLWLKTFRGYQVARVSYVPEVGSFGQIRYRKKRLLQHHP